MSNYKKIGSIAIGVMFLSIVIKSIAPMISMVSYAIQKVGLANSWGAFVFFGTIIIVNFRTF